MKRGFSVLEIVIAIALVLIVGFVIYFLFRGIIRGIRQSVSPTPTPIITITPTPESQAIEDNWLLYTSPVFNFSIKHPSDITADRTTSTGAVEMIKKGPSFNSEGEFNDGINLILSSGSFKERSFIEFVNNKRAEFENNPVVKSVSEIEEKSLAGLDGYAFEVETVYKQRYIYLLRGKNQFFEIIDNTQDPSNQGYDGLVDDILSTLSVQVDI